MNDVGWFVIVQQDPAECFGKRIEYFWAAFAPKDEAHGEVVCNLPPNAKEMPEVWVDGKDFECAGDVCRSQPSSLAGCTDEGDGVIYCCIVHGKVWARD